MGIARSKSFDTIKMMHIGELCQIQRKRLKKKHLVSNKIPIKKFNDGKK
jgi:hypothetical protein